MFLGFSSLNMLSPFSVNGCIMMLLALFQGARQSMASAHAAIRYIVLALSGHMDNILGKYKVLQPI